MLKSTLFLFAFLFSNYFLFAQVQIFRTRILTEQYAIPLDSILTISKEKFDSINQNQLFIPNNPYDLGDIDKIQGAIYTLYEIEKYNIKSVTKLRGIHEGFDSLLIIQQNTIANNIIKYGKFDTSKYFVVIGIQYLLGDSNRIYNGNKLTLNIHKEVYVLEKEMFKILINNDFYKQNKSIPKNIDESIEYLDDLLETKSKENIKKLDENTFLKITHFTLGLTIRNEWKIWEGSEIALYFSNLGINHPDDISNLILKIYYRHLTGQKIELDKIINAK